jgi:Fe-S cluster assembly iron-binding protein IscA
MKIIIFGTGIAGRAIYRKLHNTEDIIFFIDNNQSLKGKKYNGIEILPVEGVVKIDFDKVAISGVWAENMTKQLLDLGVSKDKILTIDDNSLQFSNQDRITTTDNIVREIASLMNTNNISYCIEGSSLLCLLRGQNLSDVADVDILIKSQKDLNKIWELINSNPFLKENQLTKIIYQKDKILTKKGQIDKIILKSNTDPAVTEPTVLDINLAVDIGKYYIMDYESDYYLYFNKEYVDGENIFEYKGIKLLIPNQAEKYVELLYGKNWKIPAKKFSYKDYGNLLNTKELLNFIKEHR